jgi:lysophospholipase L1-like esterase
MKNFILAASLLLTFGISSAQQKKAANDTAGLHIFPADTTVQPTASAIMIYCGSGYREKAAALISVLNRKGVSVAEVTDEKHMELQGMPHKMTGTRIGILVIGPSKQLPRNLDSVAFAGLIDIGWVSAIHIPVTTPLLISGTANNTAALLSFYNKRIKTGGSADLHLHPEAVADSVLNGEVMNWMNGLGLLTPISNEKTVAQKNRDNWTNFMKMIEDRLHNDWAWLKRFEADNDHMPAPNPGEKRVIFLGNSITEGWINQDPGFFRDHGYINRGIGGQTTPQMLVRFREDVVNLHPQVVIILAGINDIAQNTGPSRLENITGNIISMAEIAKANGIKVILCSVLPAFSFPWHPGIDPAPAIVKLNRMLQGYAEKNKLGFVNYYPAAVDEKGAFKKDLTIDGVHPNLPGYKIMEPLAEAAIEKAFSEH